MIIDPSFFNQFLQPLLMLKIAILVIIFIYFLFTIVIYTQVNTMNQIINEVHSSAILQTIAILNLLLAISLFVLALVIL